ncbi:unnamed protein product [Pleuronectes platessa]|uniref:Uncharacterized protein n=1 Tax=Pleuronectes platessa TaxID=8262 RepID=A0A9N7ZD90_PLEPL|nr:unnamed protein product [Pleuronectes platessa]
MGGLSLCGSPCEPAALSSAGRTPDAMAGIAWMTGEVARGRTLAYLSAPFSCYSFLSRTGKMAMLCRAVIYRASPSPVVSLDPGKAADLFVQLMCPLCEGHVFSRSVS